MPQSAERIKEEQKKRKVFTVKLREMKITCLHNSKYLF